MQTELEIKEQMCDIGRRIYNREMVAANDGNISVKLNDHEYLVTPTGISKGFMTPECICKVDENGNVLEAHGKYKPSTEIKLHMHVYRNRPDVQSVVHAHPLYATTYAIAGRALTEPLMPEAVVALGAVPLAEYATPGTPGVSESVTPYLQKYDAVLLANHGALTYADSLLEAYYKMEAVEFYARLLWQTEQIGGPKLLTDEQVEDLYELRRQRGLTGKHPADWK